MNTKITIMIVEDDEALVREISLFLQKWGYAVRAVHAFDRIVEEFKRIMPQLVLLDINLPYYDGFYWCAQIRRVSEVPVIYISSRDDDRDKIMAVAQGGDDYVEKPFRLEMLKAKIEALVRRAYQYRIRSRQYLTEEISFDFDTGALFYQEKEADLTKSERKILMKLLEERGVVVSREELMMTLWSTNEFISDGTLTTLVSRLRSKLTECCGQEVIQTRKGQGYWIP